MRNLTKSFSRVLATSLIKGIVVYRYLSLVADFACESVFGVTIRCKHSPSCSEYAISSIRKRGTIKGSFLGIKRILSCW